MTSTTTTHGTRQTPARTGFWLGVAVVAGILCAVLALTNAAAFWSGYLVAAIFWMAVSTGCLAITLVHSVSGGRWGRAIGRPLHAGISTQLFSFFAFALVAIGAHLVLPWAGNEAMLSTLNPHQKMWLAPWAVVARTAVAFGTFLLFGLWLNGRYRRDAADELSEAPQAPAAIGVLLFFILYSIIAIDFMMALSPTWSSSMYPLIRIMNCAVAALSLCAVAHCRRLVNPTREQLDRVQDIGNLLQAFNLLWTYVSFSQYILIWTGDIAGEVQWYMDRRTPFWMTVSVILFALHFVIPFLLMLNKSVKRGPQQLTKVATLLLVMCLVDISWTLLPSIPVPTLPAVFSTLASSLAIGGVWLFLYQRSFAALPDMAMEDDEHAASHHVVKPIPGDSI